MARYSKKFIEARFSYWAEEAGLSTECWKRIDGRNVAQIGSVYLDHAPCYGGWCINQIMNEGGGCTNVTGFGVRLTAAELIAFFDGSRWAIRHLASK
jgi:hypothetical protein